MQNRGCKLGRYETGLWRDSGFFKHNARRQGSAVTYEKVAVLTGQRAGASSRAK